ncbi:hypothetical protein RHEC894_PC00159 (plasmid) [Rhizobium sp. CIAT894]|uniref:hypothetical protein n=1 Tax=unclassified Rhizobium TaxID=2613769 RepID=UPI0001909B3C|nr:MULTISPECIES: hypothetical protein [unclassified Rhizobium]ARM91193.1 hypothetical protein RHEC894_PC00159 [Rhizobium sp. CIAT894]PDT06528.1 hypothetical protein CO655_32135 [Rhizobium sp. M1]
MNELLHRGVVVSTYQSPEQEHDHHPIDARVRPEIDQADDAARASVEGQAKAIRVNQRRVKV